MKVPYYQATKSGCSFYALANVFNDPRFIVGVEDLQKGQGVIDMNRKLQELGYDFFVAVLYCTSSKFTKQENRLVDPYLFSLDYDKGTPEQIETFVRVFFVTVKGPVHNHCILVLHSVKHNRLYMINSIQHYIEVFSVEEFIKQYHIIEVDSLESFDTHNDKNEELSTFFYKSHFSFLNLEPSL